MKKVNRNQMIVISALTALLFGLIDTLATGMIMYWGMVISWYAIEIHNEVKDGDTNTSKST